jgi:ribose transport system substrate-binding protein
MASVAASILAVVTLAGCSSASDEGGDASASPAATGSTGAADAAAEWNARVEELFAGVGFEPPTPGSPPAPTGKNVWWIAQGLGADAQTEAAAAMEEVGEKLGWEVTVFDGQFESSTALNGIEQAIAAKADGILLWAIDCSSVQTGLQAAKDANVPTIGIEGLDCDPGLFSHSVAYGPAPGRDTIEQWRAWGATQATMAIARTNAQAKVLLISETDLAITRAITEGWKATLAECETCEITAEVEFVASDFGPALQTKIEQALIQNPTVNALIPAYDAVMTSGGSTAVLASGRQDEIFVMGGEGSAPGMEQIREGTGMQACSGLESAYEAYAGVDALIWILGGKDPSGTTNGQGFQLCDKDTNMPVSGSYKASFPFRDYYYEYWGIQP